MNGLLHRMAARAAGTAVQVRSDAGLPYAGSGFGLGDAGDEPADLPGGKMAPVLRMPPVSAVSRSREWPVPPASSTEPPPLAAAAVERDAPAMTNTARIAVELDSTATLARLDAAPLMPPPALPVKSDAGFAHAVMPEAEIALARREIAAPGHIAIHADEPAPMLPRAARPAPLTPVAPPSPRHGALPQGAAPSPSEADTEVHIHIGRIDVTAVHETPAPRRRAPAGPAPMSLDGYLAKRGGS